MPTIIETYEVDLRNALTKPALSGRFLGIFPRHERKEGFPVRDSKGKVVLVLTPEMKRAHFSYSLHTMAGEELAVLDLGMTPGIMGGFNTGSFKPSLGAGGELAWDKAYVPSQERQPGGAPFRLDSEGRYYLIANGAALGTFDMIDIDRFLVADGRLTRSDRGYHLESVTINAYAKRPPMHLLVGACWWRAQCLTPKRPGS